MFLELNNRNPNQIAEGYVKRESIKYHFNYETVDGRRYTRDDPMQGMMCLKANMSIKTNTDFPFVKGDLVYLQESTHPLRVVNVTQRFNEKQYMFLEKSTQIEYTLDLE